MKLLTRESWNCTVNSYSGSTPPATEGKRDAAHRSNVVSPLQCPRPPCSGRCTGCPSPDQVWSLPPRSAARGCSVHVRLIDVVGTRVAWLMDEPPAIRPSPKPQPQPETSAPTFRVRDPMKKSPAPMRRALRLWALSDSVQPCARVYAHARPWLEARGR
jgi:hypothetical protein